MDFKGHPFGPIPNLCAIADEVTQSACHLRALRCALAYVSHRLIHSNKCVLLGEQSEYEHLSAGSAIRESIS